MKQIEHFDAAGLDFDGTIANTRAAMTESRLESFKSIGEDLDDERYLSVDPAIQAEAHHHGSNPMGITGWVLFQSGIISDVVAEQDTVKRVVDRRNEIYWEKAKKGFDAIPGSIDTILMLHNYFGSKLTIVTTAPRNEEVMPFLDRYELTDLFNTHNLITRKDVRHLKPSPEAYLLAISRLGSTANRFLALEDSNIGILSARRAGIAEVAALTTTHTAEQLQALKEDERPTIITPTHADFQRVFLT